MMLMSMMVVLMMMLMMMLMVELLEDGVVYGKRDVIDRHEISRCITNVVP